MAKVAKRQSMESAALPEERLLSMEEAIELLQTTRSTFYRWITQGAIKGNKVGRQWRFEKAEVERFLRGGSPELNLGREITAAFEILAEQFPELNATNEEESADHPVLKLIRRIIAYGIDLGASDIHLEAQEDGCRLRYRVDGVLLPLPPFASALQPALLEQWKALFKANTQERQRPQDGKMQHERNATTYDLRVSTIPSYYGESLVARIQDRNTMEKITLENLLGEKAAVLQQALNSRYGLIVFTGPVGCGKTTLAYASLQHLNTPQVKLLTVEDPVVHALDGVVQVPVQNAIGRTIPSILRALMRQDPDAIYVSELPDEDSAQLCVQAALTGHLVLTTLHTQTAAAALKRLTELGVAPLLTADATRLIVAQRLLRKLCPHCVRQEKPTPAEAARFQRLAQENGLESQPVPATLPRATGCEQCKQLGFRGRQVILEMLKISPEITTALKDKASAKDLQAIAVEQGMSTLAAEGIKQVVHGVTTLEEVCGVLAL